MLQESVSTSLVSGLVGGVVGAAVTVIGWYVTHRQTAKAQKRRDKLDLVTKQLTEFYGPLHVACEAGRIADEALIRKLGLSEGIFDNGRQPSEGELAEWFLWMEHVFAPLNDAREELIMKKLYLIREHNVPQQIHTFVAHVTLCRAMLAKWKKGDRSELFAPVQFPVGLDQYAEQGFRDLKQEQHSLIETLT
jgi:hypothetical protein